MICVAFRLVTRTRTRRSSIRSLRIAGFRILIPFTFLKRLQNYVRLSKTP